nr:hypothetical protein [Haliscomenobacter sp.]
MIGTKGVMTCGTYGLVPKVYLKNGNKLEMPPLPAPAAGTPSVPEYGHQRSWTNACKAGFISKEHLELTSSLRLFRSTSPKRC